MKITHVLIAAMVVLCSHGAMASAAEPFEPSATLVPERDGEYTLRVATVAPNACYSAGAVKLGPPADVRLSGEAVAVRVALRVRGGRCAQVLKTIRHSVRNLKLGPAHGKSSVLVFAMLGGKVVGSSSVPVPLPPSSGASVTTSDWHAWVSKMPPGPASFQVTGMVSVPTPGYEAKLVVASPQGKSASELILDLSITKKPGVWPQVITQVPVRHEQKSYSGSYRTVLIREPDGDTAQAAVEEVH